MALHLANFMTLFSLALHVMIFTYQISYWYRVLKIMENKIRVKVERNNYFKGKLKTQFKIFTI